MKLTDKLPAGSTMKHHMKTTLANGEEIQTVTEWDFTGKTVLELMTIACRPLGIRLQDKLRPMSTEDAKKHGNSKIHVDLAGIKPVTRADRIKAFQALGLDQETAEWAADNPEAFKALAERAKK